MYFVVIFFIVLGLNKKTKNQQNQYENQNLLFKTQIIVSKNYYLQS